MQKLIRRLDSGFPPRATEHRVSSPSPVQSSERPLSQGPCVTRPAHPLLGWSFRPAASRQLEAVHCSAGKGKSP